MLAGHIISLKGKVVKHILGGSGTKYFIIYGKSYFLCIREYKSPHISFSYRNLHTLVTKKSLHYWKWQMIEYSVRLHFLSQASLYGIYGGKVARLQIVCEYFGCPPCALFHQCTICLHLCYQYYKIKPTDSGVQ